VAAGRDRFGVRVRAFGDPPARDVADRVDPDLETSLLEPFDEPVAGLTVGVRSGQDRPSPALLGLDPADVSVRLQIRTEPFSIYFDVHAPIPGPAGIKLCRGTGLRERLDVFTFGGGSRPRPECVIGSERY